MLGIGKSTVYNGRKSLINKGSLDPISHLLVAGSKFSKRARSRLDNGHHRHRHLSRMDRPDEKVCAVNYRKFFRNGRIAKPGSTQ